MWGFRVWGLRFLWFSLSGSGLGCVGLRRVSALYGLWFRFRVSGFRARGQKNALKGAIRATIRA